MKIKATHKSLLAGTIFIVVATICSIIVREFDIADKYSWFILISLFLSYQLGKYTQKHWWSPKNQEVITDNL